MKFHWRSIVFVVLVASVAYTAAPQTVSQRTSGPALVALEAAKKKEVIDGDLEAAIRQYKEIISQYGSQAAVAADALLRMADAYRKLGDVESRKIYEQLVRDYANQTEVAAQARSRLGEDEVPYSATVTPTEARFVFPISAQQEWEWFQGPKRGRRVVPENGAEYLWWIEVQSAEKRYQIGYSLFRPPGSTPQRGRLDNLLHAGLIGLAEQSPGGKTFSMIPFSRVWITPKGSQLVVSVDNPQSIQQVFGGKPARARFLSQVPGEDAVVREVPVTYREK